MNLSDAFHQAADSTNDANDHDELHAAGMILHLDLITGDLDDGALLNVAYVKRWITNLRMRHGIRSTHDRRL